MKTISKPKRHNPRIGESVVHLDGRALPIASYPLYQPESAAGIYTLATSGGEVRASWNETGWVEIGSPIKEKNLQETKALGPVVTRRPVSAKRKERAMPAPAQKRGPVPAVVTEIACPPPAPSPDVVAYIPRSRPVCTADDVRTCRVCGCTDDDCSGCIERTGRPCSWVGRDLCSACQKFPGITHSSAHRTTKGATTVD